MSKVKSDGKPFEIASEFIYMYIYGHLKYVRWTKLQAPVNELAKGHFVNCQADSIYNILLFFLLKKCE